MSRALMPRPPRLLQHDLLLYRLCSRSIFSRSRRFVQAVFSPARLPVSGLGLRMFSVDFLFVDEPLEYQAWRRSRRRGRPRHRPGEPMLKRRHGDFSLRQLPFRGFKAARRKPDDPRPRRSRSGVFGTNCRGAVGTSGGRCRSGQALATRSARCRRCSTAERNPDFQVLRPAGFPLVETIAHPRGGHGEGQFLGIASAISSASPFPLPGEHFRSWSGAPDHPATIGDGGAGARRWGGVKASPVFFGGGCGQSQAN